MVTEVCFERKIMLCHSSDPPPSSWEGGSKFWLPPPEGGIWKIKKGGGSMTQEHVFLKEGVDTLPV